MKKLVLMLAVVFSMSFFACGNKEQATEATAEEVAIEEAAPVAEEVAVAVDSLNDTTVVVETAEVAEAPVAE